MSEREPRDLAHEPGKRLFVGIRVSVGTANNLAHAAETLARRARDAGVDVRWVAPTNYHVTLKFLGWTRVAAIGAVRDALDAAAAGTPRMTLRATRLGAFAALDKASVIWAGVEEQSGALGELAKRLEARCAALGFRAERRPFHAHVTLGRVREIASIREVVLPLSEQMFGDTRVDSVTLFESETKSTGSVYRELHRINFKTAANTGSEASERQTPAVQVGAPNRSNESSITGSRVAELDAETDDGWPRGRHHDQE